MVLTGLAVVAVMALGLPALVLGLPGLWLMVAGLGVLSLLGFAGWLPPAVGVGAVLAAELAELGLLKRFGRARGATRRAFWGAVAGGFLGILVGLPVPLVGPVVAAFTGTFLGALAVTLVETRSLPGAARVGWGMVLARTAAVVVKAGTGSALLAWALLLVVRRGLAAGA
jgi:hypothetical protein